MKNTYVRYCILSKSDAPMFGISGIYIDGCKGRGLAEARDTIRVYQRYNWSVPLISNYNKNV